MIADLNKQIQLVEYNFLNLLQKVTTDLHAIDYDYDAAGTKLRKKVVQGNNTTTTDYIGGIHYINGSIDFIQNSPKEELIERRTEHILTAILSQII